MKKDKKDVGPYSAFVNDMLKKAESKDSVAEPQSLMAKDVKRDPPLKSSSLFMKDEDEKKVEEHIKKMKDSIK